MKKYRIPLISMITALTFLSTAAIAQSASPVRRTDLQRHDISIPGHEAIQVRVDFDPKAVAPSHKHPGEEIIYVLEGELEYTLQGQKPVVLKAGGVLFVPAGVYHSAKNVGSSIGRELATYVVEKGKPLVELAK